MYTQPPAKMCGRLTRVTIVAEITRLIFVLNSYQLVLLAVVQACPGSFLCGRGVWEVIGAEGRAVGPFSPSGELWIYVYTTVYKIIVKTRWIYEQVSIEKKKSHSRVRG